MDAIRELEEQITRYATSYYTGQSEISDSEFDNLVDRLRMLDPTNKLLTTAGWGYTPTLNKDTHNFSKVVGLSKYRDVDNLLKSLSNVESIVLTPKYDGISCVAYYRYGKLIKAITRGNGIEGTNITDKLRLITNNKSLTTELSDSELVAIRGELVIPKYQWDYLQSDKFSMYKNSRNAVAGIINSKEFSECLKYVKFVPYKIHGNMKNLRHLSMEYVLNLLKEEFSTATNYLSLDNKNSLSLDLLKVIKDKLGSDYDCDGTVVSSNDIELASDYSYEYIQYAFKFEDEKAESKVNEIKWNLTRTGKLTPVAIIDPVELDGATIKRVTCFNAKYVEENGLGPDAIIEIQRSGMVIPDINNVIIKSPNVELPKVCPVCGSELEMIGTDLRCTNNNCMASIYNRLYYWISRISAVKGVGSSGIDEFIDILGFTDIYSIYRKTKDECLELIDKSAIGTITRNKYVIMVNNLYDYIDPRYFFYALNINGIGWTMAGSLADNNIHEYLREDNCNLNNVNEILHNLPNCGYVTACTIMDNIELLSTMAKSVKGFKSLDKTESNPNNGKVRTFAITGSLNYGTRSEFVEFLKSKNWEWTKVKDAEYLITNDTNPQSSKYKEAIKLGIPVITENEFMKYIGEI